MSGRRRPRSTVPPEGAREDAGTSVGPHLPVAIVQDAMAAAGLEPADLVHLLRLPDHYELVVRHIVGLTESPYETRTVVTHGHALAFAEAIAQIDSGAAVRLTAAIAQTEAEFRVAAARAARRGKRRAASAKRARRARPRRKARASARRRSERSRARPLPEPLVPVEVLQRLVERIDATPQAIARLTGRRPQDVRIMLGLVPDSGGRVHRAVRAASARSIAGALVMLAQAPYEKRILAKELTRAESTAGVRLVAEIPR
jgi:hypothetical protein